MKSGKTAIIIHGGAVKGAFAAGVLYRLAELGVRNADVVIGTSASLPTAAYFSTHQFREMKDIWTKEVGTPEFVEYKNLATGKPVFNLQYLIEKIFRQRYKLDVSSLSLSPSGLKIPLYDYREGKLELISSRGLDEEEFWHALQAGMTIHDKHIQWGTRWERFVDADLDPFALYRQGVITEDMNFLIISNHRELENTWRKWAGLRIFRLLQSKHFPGGVKAKLRIREELITAGLVSFRDFCEKHSPLIVMPPEDAKLKMWSVLQRNQARLKGLFEVGNSTRFEKGALEAFIRRSVELEPYLNRELSSSLS